MAYGKHGEYQMLLDFVDNICSSTFALRSELGCWACCQDAMAGGFTIHGLLLRTILIVLARLQH